MCYLLGVSSFEEMVDRDIKSGLLHQSERQNKNNELNKIYYKISDEVNSRNSCKQYGISCVNKRNRRKLIS